MKQKQFNGMRSLLVTAFLLLSFGVFYSCQKNYSASSNSEGEVMTPIKTDRLLSVANVYKTEGGKTFEAWFYETPVVFEFSTTGPNAERYFEMLKNAKDNNEVVNVRLNSNISNQIDAIIAPTAEQITVHKAEVAIREKEVVAKISPPDGDKEGSTNLTGVIPNMATLNTIFNKIKTQCCKSTGPYIYGQCIPFQYVADGCYARAQKMRQVIESYYGYTSYKIFNYACNAAGTLAVKATLWNNNCCVRWWYHVTSWVYVQEGSSQKAYAIDPAMFTGPVSISTWIAAQKNTSCGYNGGTQTQLYYTSNAYNLSNSNNCTIVVYGDNGYTSANTTCAAYATKQGCF